MAPLYAEVLGAKTVLEDVGGIRGPWRLPQVRWVWGDGTETVHLENGVRFKLDASKVMFSSGNMDERIRMARVPAPGETVVDLFAGIGYFSVPMAVHARPARVVACEANPVAHGFLEENVRINRATAVEPRLGDCRDVAPKGVADRVVMGHFDALEYFDVALRSAKDRAAIHLHALVGPRRGTAALLADLETGSRGHGFEVASTAVRRVKSHGQRVWHVVVDAQVQRA